MKVIYFDDTLTEKMIELFGGQLSKENILSFYKEYPEEPSIYTMKEFQTEFNFDGSISDQGSVLFVEDWELEAPPILMSEDEHSIIFINVYENQLAKITVNMLHNFGKEYEDRHSKEHLFSLSRMEESEKFWGDWKDKKQLKLLKKELKMLQKLCDIYNAGYIRIIE